MAYNDKERDLREKAAADFHARRLADDEAHKARLAELSASVPGFAGLTRQLEATALNVFRAALEGTDCGDVRRETEAIREKRRALLAANGYPEDYADRKYRCAKCSDSGFVGLSMCSCLRRELTVAALESSGLGKLIGKQSFDTFSLGYYEGRDRAIMQANVKKLRAFAEGFSDKTTENLLLIGGTGLGKTHLATSVARVVIEKGYDVVYRPAGEFFAVFNRQRFGDGYEGDGAERAFFDCDLLILDDLGTEVTTQYTVSWLYDVINSRLNAERPTLVSTNLTEDALRSRYDDRLTSRIFGNYAPLFFLGKDVRAQKTGNAAK